jgi:biotin transport system substrate-specific component
MESMTETQTRKGWLAGVGVALGAAAVILAARISFSIPGTDVLQTGQTLAVVLCGALLGARYGTAAILVYLGLGAVGAPVFADGASGFSHLTGSTSGFLFGFLVAAWMTGALRDAGRLDPWRDALIGLVAAHGVILGLGWARLVLVPSLSLATAFTAGVAPFISGALVKSALGVGVIWAAERFGRPRLEREEELDDDPMD